MGDKAHDTWDALEKAQIRLLELEMEHAIWEKHGLVQLVTENASLRKRVEELTHLWAKDNNALVDALLQNKRLLDTIEEIKSTTCKLFCEHTEGGFSQCSIHWLAYHATDKNNQKANKNEDSGENSESSEGSNG
jgi:ribonuclease HI